MTFLAIFKMQQQKISISSKISASGGIYCIDVSTVRRYTVGVCCSTLVMEGAFYIPALYYLVLQVRLLEWRLNKYAENSPAEHRAAKLFISVLTLTNHHSPVSTNTVWHWTHPVIPPILLSNTYIDKEGPGKSWHI